MAHERPDVVMFAQFLLRDIEAIPGTKPGSRRRWRQYQTGLMFNNGEGKPSLNSFVLPFFAQRRSGAIQAFGEVRPGKGRQRVAIEKRGRGGRWRRAAAFDTEADGTFRRELRGAGSYRLRWDSRGNSAYSTPVDIAPR
jgi:hypothetical protein